MTLNVSGPISLIGSTTGQSVAVELGLSPTGELSLLDSRVRTLANVPSGALTMPTNLYGKSNRVAISYTFSANTANASLNLSAISGYSAGTSDITVTINGGVYLYATSTGGYGLNLSGGTTGDTLTVVNNGYIMGQGGNGGNATGTSTNAQSGGSALNLGFGMSSCTINNTNGSAYIGGGGGGGAQGYYDPSYSAGGGGGAGGGSGGTNNNGDAGGAGGSIGSSGSNGNFVSGQGATGGGGGRVFPGVGGASASASSSTSGGYGATGGGSGGVSAKSSPGTYGAGGSSNNSGSNGYRGNFAGVGAGGGGWGASGGATTQTSTGGGSGGKAVNTNGKSITWTSGDTSRVWGSVS